jgi:hypothetical protein
MEGMIGKAARGARFSAGERASRFWRGRRARPDWT